MESVLAAIESFPPVVALRRSFVAYPVVNAAHILGVGTLVTSVLVMHWHRLRDRGGRAGQAETMLRPVAIVGLVVAAMTGFALFSIRAGDYADNAAFRIKLLLIAIALANLALHHVLQRRGRIEMMRLTAVLSAALWIGVLLAGRFIGFVE